MTKFMKHFQFLYKECCRVYFPTDAILATTSFNKVNGKSADNIIKQETVIAHPQNDLA